MTDDTHGTPPPSEYIHLEPATAAQAAEGSTSPAGFWLRAIAKLADWLVAVTIAGTLLIALLALLHALGMSSLGVLWLLVVGSFLLPVFYFAYFNSAGRQTLGYRLAGIRVETMGHQSVGWWRSLGRAIIAVLFQGALSIYIGFIDYLMVAFSRSKRAAHDLLSGTRVVRVAPPQTVKLIVCAVAFPVLTFWLRPFHLFLQAYYIPSGAMEDTLQWRPVEDRILVSKLIYRLRDPQFQDVIVFRAPPATRAEPGTDFVKRCMGVPEDVVYTKGRQYYRNGRLIAEPYVKWSEDSNYSYAYDMKIVQGIVYSREYAEADVPGFWRVNGVPVPESEQKKINEAPPERIPPDRFLMLGDHRNNSNDSHVWGLVRRADLVGEAMLIYWPAGRLREL